MFHEVVEFPSGHGGCGLLSAMRSRVPAHWASWADSLRTIHCRHPALADMMVRSLSEPTGFRHFDAAASCREELCNHGYGAPGSSTSSSSPWGVGHSPRRLAAGCIIILGAALLGLCVAASGFSGRARVAPLPRWPPGGTPFHRNACLSSSAVPFRHLSWVVRWSLQQLACVKR